MRRVTVVRRCARVSCPAVALTKGLQDLAVNVALGETFGQNLDEVRRAAPSAEGAVG